MPRGGVRKGAGRKRIYNEPTKRVEVPIRLIDRIKSFINELLTKEDSLK